MLIRHLSFDLWLTLIKSNPVFKIKRAEYFFNKYNPHKIELIQLKQLIHEIDKKCDDYNEKTGTKVPVTLMYSMILTALGSSVELITEEILNHIKFNIDSLFLDFKPFLLNEKVKITIENLKNDGYKLNLASNTGFIEGNVIINVLNELDLYDYFDFFIFSDEIGASKPSAFFYDCVYDKLKNNMNKNEVMHIGDNYYADFLGAIHYGFQALHICEQQFTYYDIIKEINERNYKSERLQNTGS